MPVYDAMPLVELQSLADVRMADVSGLLNMGGEMPAEAVAILKKHGLDDQAAEAAVKELMDAGLVSYGKKEGKEEEPAKEPEGKMPLGLGERRRAMADKLFGGGSKEEMA